MGEILEKWKKGNHREERKWYKKGKQNMGVNCVEREGEKIEGNKIEKQ